MTMAPATGIRSLAERTVPVTSCADTLAAQSATKTKVSLFMDQPPGKVRLPHIYSTSPGSAAGRVQHPVFTSIYAVLQHLGVRITRIGSDDSEVSTSYGVNPTPKQMGVDCAATHGKI